MLSLMEEMSLLDIKAFKVLCHLLKKDTMNQDQQSKVLSLMLFINFSVIELKSTKLNSSQCTWLLDGKLNAVQMLPEMFIMHMIVVTAFNLLDQTSQVIIKTSEK